ncbi:MAG TPA: hypothetical protein VL309_09745 [Vicinamibacterales bacterium]|nr:hypothetical protein [Vicinamibacterales bacterium]
MSEARGRSRTWRSALLAAAIIGGAAAALFVAGGAWVIYRQTRAEFVGADRAAAEFDEVLARFADQPALVELRGVDLPVVRRSATAPRHDVHVLHVLSYDPLSRKLVHADVPGWMLEWLSAHGTIRLANLELFDDSRDRLTLEDLERHTPGIIVSGAARTRVLVWTE